VANEGCLRAVTDCHVHTMSSQSPSRLRGLSKRPKLRRRRCLVVLIISETSPSCSIAGCVISADCLQRPCPPCRLLCTLFLLYTIEQKRVLDALRASHSDVADLDTHSNSSPDFIPATTYNSPHSLPNFSPAKSYQNGQYKKKGSK
jgi:hypothetical protein